MVTDNRSNTGNKNYDIFFKIKKLLVNAIFDPEYSEFFINRFYENIMEFVPQGTLSKFEFNDLDKFISLSFNLPQITDDCTSLYIRNALAKTYVEIASTGRMCDILYLKDADSFNLFNSRFIYGNKQEETYNNPDYFNPEELSFMFNINSFGNGNYVLSLIQ